MDTNHSSTFNSCAILVTIPCMCLFLNIKKKILISSTIKDFIKKLCSITQSPKSVYLRPINFNNNFQMMS